MIMLGVVGLLIVAYVAKNLLAVEAKAPPPADDLLPMAVADIAPGTLLTEAHLGRGPYPKSRLEPDMLRTSRVIVGRYSRVALRSNQPIHANDLLPPGEMPSLKVAEGMRAIAVEVADSTAMVGGMIRPNDYVDVLFTYQGRNDDSLQGGITMRLFEGVRVLAVKNGGGNRGDRGNHVTLEVTEPQVNILTLARDRGTITLSYNPNGRGGGGLALSSADRVTLYEILGLKPAEPPFMTDIYRGSSRATNRFNSDGRLMENNTSGGQDRPQQQLPTNSAPAQSYPHSAPATPGRPADSQQPVEQSTAPTAARILEQPK